MQSNQTETDGPRSLQPDGSAAAMRAAERILSGVDCGAVRYHGPRADGQWCWQYRSASQIAAIIEEEMGKPQNGEVRHSAGKTECDQKEKDQ